jgi:hypothetical protein
LSLALVLALLVAVVIGVLIVASGSRRIGIAVISVVTARIGRRSGHRMERDGEKECELQGLEYHFYSPGLIEVKTNDQHRKVNQVHVAVETEQQKEGGLNFHTIILSSSPAETRTKDPAIDSRNRVR